MTFMHIPNLGLPKRLIGERRSDHGTAAKIHDALRAQGRQAVAQALAHQDVDMTLALRVLGAAQRRRALAAEATGLAA
jgi:hypothetical protein